MFRGKLSHDLSCYCKTLSEIYTSQSYWLIHSTVHLLCELIYKHWLKMGSYNTTQCYQVNACAYVLRARRHNLVKRKKTATESDIRSVSLFFYYTRDSAKKGKMCIPHVIKKKRLTGHTVILSGSPVLTHYVQLEKCHSCRCLQNGPKWKNRLSRCISVVPQCLLKFTGASQRSAAWAKWGKRGLKPNMEDMQVCCLLYKSSFVLRRDRFLFQPNLDKKGASFNNPTLSLFNV